MNRVLVRRDRRYRILSRGYQIKEKSGREAKCSLDHRMVGAWRLIYMDPPKMAVSTHCKKRKHLFECRLEEGGEVCEKGLPQWKITL